MKNNLAELLDVDIDPNLLYDEWLKQIEYSTGHAWKSRNYVGLNFFTTYFQALLQEINNIVGEKPKNYIIQCHATSLIDSKWYLNIAHKDADRKTCITIPLAYSKLESINFYDDNSILSNERKNFNIKPSQIGRYSEKHPTLVNVNNYHNVRILDNKEPRVLLQLSYDLTFEEITCKQINTSII